MGEIHLPDFKTYYTATVISIMCYGWSSRHTDQWNRTKSPELESHKYAQLIFSKGAKAMK